MSEELLSADEVEILFRKAEEGYTFPLDRLRRHIAALEKERDAALADNAAKTETIQRMRNLLLYPTMDADATRLEVLRLGLDAVTHPGPGAALLEELETLRGRQALWEDAATALYGYAEFIGPCAHGRDPWDRCDECGEKNAVYAAQKVIVKMTEEHRKKWEAERVRLGNVLARLSEEVEHFSGKPCAAALSSILSGIERVAVRARNEGLEKAAARADACATESVGWTARAPRKVASWVADEIRALEEPEE